MRIGLFTDSYHPAKNGVVLAVDMARAQLEELGHEVFVFAPDGAAVNSRKKMPKDPHIFRLPAIQYDLQLSLFFPPKLLRQIRALKLDIIQFFTPAQIGLMASLAARKTGAVLVGKHSTDTYEFSKDYRAMALAYFFAGMFSPLFVKLSSEQKKTFAKLYLSPMEKETDEKYSQRLIAGLMSILYANCDGVWAVSEKSARQLAEFAARNGEKLNLRVIPDGVDNLPAPTAAQIADFREKFGVSADDEVILYFGRMAEEKNLPLLISAFEIIAAKNPRAKLVFAGGYVFLDKLREMAQKTDFSDRIIFTDYYPREILPAICATAKVFAFPSLTDTQALVLNEAAWQNLPIVMIDRDVNDVFRENFNGFLAENNAEDFASKISEILENEDLRAKFAKNSRRLAAEFSEKNQIEKLVEFYRELLRAPMKK